MLKRPLRVAMALHGDVTHDSRVLREADSLGRAGHSVTVFCLAGIAPPNSRFQVTAAPAHSSGVAPAAAGPSVAASRGRLPRRIAWGIRYLRRLRSWGRWAYGAAGAVDVWHVHDFTALLAIGPLVRRPTRLIYDSHEIFLEAGSAARLPWTLRLVLRGLERATARKATALVTVNEGYADILEGRLRPRRTVIVRNCPPVRRKPERDESRLRRSLSLNADVPLILYHGLFGPHRGIEQSAEALLKPGLRRAHLAFLGYGSLREDLVTLAANPRFGGRLHIIDAVPPSELLDWVEGADVDIIALQPTTLNHWLCTPNKLWESITAGVPVVVSDFPLMAAIVANDPDGSLGAVCDPTDPVSIATAIQSILDMPEESSAQMRGRSWHAARDRWNWEAESRALINLYAELASARP